MSGFYFEMKKDISHSHVSHKKKKKSILMFIDLSWKGEITDDGFA